MKELSVLWEKLLDWADDYPVFSSILIAILVLLVLVGGFMLSWKLMLALIMGGLIVWLITMIVLLIRGL